MDVQKWRDEAHVTLEKAQHILVLAQSTIDATTALLTGQLRHAVDTAVAAHTGVSEKHRSTQALVAQCRQDVLRSIEAHNTACSAVLDPALAELDAVVADLAAVQVPANLTVDSSGDGSLADFISLSEILLLRRNIAIYKKNGSKAAAYLRLLVAQVALDWDACQALRASLGATFDSAVAPAQAWTRQGPSGADLPAQILRENTTLGAELSSLLGMLTKHYTQCEQALAFAKTAPALAEAAEVLQADAAVLPAVLLEARAIHDILANNERRAAAFVDLKAPVLASFAESCTLLGRRLDDVRQDSLGRLLVLLVQAQAVFDRCLDPQAGMLPPELYAAILKLLGRHFRQFMAVFSTQYLSELHYEQFVYPRKFLKLLDEHLNGHLLQLEDDERRRRQDWLLKYGEFIPKSFRLPGEHNQPRVVQVVSEGLDDLNSPTAQADEEQLLALIRRVRVGKH